MKGNFQRPYFVILTLKNLVLQTFNDVFLGLSAYKNIFITTNLRKNF